MRLDDHGEEVTLERGRIYLRDRRPRMVTAVAPQIAPITTYSSKVNTVRAWGFKTGIRKAHHPAAAGQLIARANGTRP